MVCRKVCQCVGCILRRTWYRLCRLSGRKPQTEGNQLHSFRSICGRGTEARNHQSDRTGNAGDRCSDSERVIREDHKQYAGVQEPWCILMGMTTYGNYEIEDQVNFAVYVPKVDEHFMASLAVIPLQLLGYYVSVAKGLDVDKPRNLAKSVTVE